MQIALVFTHIIKRGGAIMPFDASKIAQALERASQVTGEFDAAEAGRLTQYLVLPKVKVQGHVTPHIEQIQDAVEAATGLRPEASTTGGTSDARFIRALCPVLELGLVGQTMHQVDERVPVAELEALTATYRRVIETVQAAV